MTQNGRNSEIHVKFLSTIVALAGVALILLGTHYRTQIGIAGDVQFVPDLVGMDFDEADIVLRRIGLVAKPVQRTFRNVEGVGVEERLRIIDQSEQPETRVDRLSVLKVAVEETRRVVTIPDVVDHAVKEAISMLNDRDLAYQVMPITAVGAIPEMRCNFTERSREAGRSFRMASFELAQRGGMGGGGLREGVVVRQDPVGGTQVLVRDRVVVKLWVRLESGQGGMGGGGFH